MSGAGLKKCMPTTRSGCLAAAAIAVTNSDEVFVASTHFSLTISSESRLYSSCLSAIRSGAASITSSHGANAASSSTGSIRASGRIRLHGAQLALGRFLGEAVARVLCPALQGLG